MTCPNEVLPDWTAASGMSGLIPASLNNRKWLVRTKLCQAKCCTVPAYPLSCHLFRLKLHSWVDSISELL